MVIDLVPDEQPVGSAFPANVPDNTFDFLGREDATDPAVAIPGNGADGGIFGSPSDAADSAPKKKRVAMSRKMKKSMDKLKTKVANIPIMWFHAQASEHPEWELDEDEKDLLTDSIETVFEVLDIGFEIEPISATLTSIWWIVAYPFAAFLFLFFTKKSQIEQKQPQDGE